MNIEELKKKALAATPGPWAWDDNNIRDADYDEKEYAPWLVASDEPVLCGQIRANTPENADYIAAANPAAVLGLIEKLDAAHTELELVRDDNHKMMLEIDWLRRQRDELLAALKDARELVDDWGAYASNYMQEKHDLAGDLAKLDAVIAKAEG